MIKDVNDRIDYYFILPEIRQALLNWGYELTKTICNDFFFVHIKMSYYWFNRKELLQKAKDRSHWLFTWLER